MPPPLLRLRQMPSFRRRLASLLHVPFSFRLFAKRLISFIYQNAGRATSSPINESLSDATLAQCLDVSNFLLISFGELTH